MRRGLIWGMAAVGILLLQEVRADGPAATEPAGPTGAAVTIYSSADPAAFDPQQYMAQVQPGYGYGYGYGQPIPGFGIVKEVRDLDLQAGNNNVAITDIAALIDPTTVSFTDLKDPNTSVLEQRFEFDLVSAQKILDKYIDQTVAVRDPLGDGKFEEVTGKLLSTNNGQLVIQTETGLRLLNSTDIQLGKLPEGLITKPTLKWLIHADKAGTHQVRTTYQTNGLTWRADYHLVLNADDTQASLGAWVTLLNQSGMTYRDAQLKLIAGDVQRVQGQNYGRQWAQFAAFNDRTYGGFEEKTFFEYHLYTLPRPTDIRQNSTEQIALFPTVDGVHVDKVFVYYGLPENISQYYTQPYPQQDRNLGNQSNSKVDVYVQVKNDEKNKLGMPLPRGKVRVYKQDTADGALEFVGEDVIDHTPKGETLLVKVGQAFDIVGERTQTDFSVNEGGHEITETIKIELRNAKTDAAHVIVKENLFRWVNWQITKNSDDYKKIDSRTIHFEVDVPASGKKDIEYTVKYTW